MITGVVLAAGAGVRAGGPKVLRRDARGEPWLSGAVAALRGGGCERVLVVLGAQAEDALGLVPYGSEVVIATDWAEGVSASLRAGLAAAAPAESAVITLVDLPGLPAPAVARLVHDARPRSLRRAVFHGRPGHPVLIGREHWVPLLNAISGDTGAGPYLSTHSVEEIDCSDLWDGEDIDGVEPP